MKLKKFMLIELVKLFLLGPKQARPALRFVIRQFGMDIRISDKAMGH